MNMKPAGTGSPVEWHQDWAFYPHTNDDILAVGVVIDDMRLDNGCLMVVPGSHLGPVLDHHAAGRFVGSIDPAAIDPSSCVALEAPRERSLSTTQGFSTVLHPIRVAGHDGCSLLSTLPAMPGR